MANQTPLRPGQVDNAGDVQALFNEIATGEILTAYEEAVVTDGMFMERNITSGKSAEFAVMGRASGFFHVPGEEILGGTIADGERIIGIDGKLVSPFFIDSLDEAMAHIELRSPKTSEAGIFLANQNDRHRLQVGVLAARATATLSELPGGTTISETVAGDFDDGAKLFDALEEASAVMDENSVPTQDRYCFLPPRRYNALARLDDLVDEDVAAGNGDKASLTVKIAAGFKIMKTIHLPSTNITGTTVAAGGSRAAYVGNYTGTKGLCIHKSAIGTVKIIGTQVNGVFDNRRLGWDYKTWQAIGHGVLRPEAAIELSA
mgnify:CR=1 FL=1